jgi:hypothetical protein
MKGVVVDLEASGTPAQEEFRVPMQGTDVRRKAELFHITQRVTQNCRCYHYIYSHPRSYARLIDLRHHCYIQEATPCK